MIIPSKEFWEVFKSTNGALSCAEALAITNIANQAVKGIWMELGTHKGKSTMAACVPHEKCEMFFLIEPEFGKEINAVEVLNGVQKASGIDFDKLIWKADYSTNVIDKFGIYSYVFVDSGSHQDGLPMQEVKLLEDRMVQGGIIAFHDFDSQFKEVREAADYLVSTGKYDYIPINWEEINKYVDENNLEVGNISWHHQEMRNPNFVGAVRRK